VQGVGSGETNPQLPPCRPSGLEHRSTFRLPPARAGRQLGRRLDPQATGGRGATNRLATGRDRDHVASPTSRPSRGPTRDHVASPTSRPSRGPTPDHVASPTSRPERGPTPDHRGEPRGARHGVRPQTTGESREAPVTGPDPRPPGRAERRPSRGPTHDHRGEPTHPPPPQGLIPPTGRDDGLGSARLRGPGGSCVVAHSPVMSLPTRRFIDKFL
jgi:hypothetical protein